jgi:hypothetical protein
MNVQLNYGSIGNRSNHKAWPHPEKAKKNSKAYLKPTNSYNLKRITPLKSLNFKLDKPFNDG